MTRKSQGPSTLERVCCVVEAASTSGDQAPRGWWVITVPTANLSLPVSSLTKGGLNAATKSLAIEYAKRGIRVNAVAPGNIKTPMYSAETYVQLEALEPIGHLGKIADIVDAILYLEGAGFVTGEILHVDGGQSAGH